MAFFLGTESCIDSLRNDLKDIQETVDEILATSPTIKCYSWKSPDKLASDLPIRDLMDRFKFEPSDEVANQIAHYSLLELIVDRLLLLVHLSSTFADTSLQQDQNSNSNKINRLNAGLTIKKYWNKFSHMNVTLRQLNCQQKASTVKRMSITEDNIIPTSKTSISSKSNTTKLNNSNKGQHAISTEVGSKGTQTNETAFVPCTSCARVQKNLQQNADLLINMCHYQNIVSNVGKFRSGLMSTQLVGGWLNGDDLEKWLLEQDKDLNKLNKELEFLNKNNELVKSKLSENESLMAKMVNNEKEMKKSLKEEQDIRTTTVKQYEKKLSDLKVDYETRVNKMNEQIKELEASIDGLNKKNEFTEKTIAELRESNKLLTDDLDCKNDLNEKLKLSEEERLKLSIEMDCLKRELNEKSNELLLERDKLNGLIRSEQSLKLKLESSLEQIDKLTADSDELKLKHSKYDSEKAGFKLDIDKLKDEIQFKNKEIEDLKYEIEILNNSIENFKVDIKKVKENEVLLLRYPDLYGPIEQLNPNEMNVCDEMLNQISANKHRIHLLESLNKKLSNSIKKLNETQVIEQKDEKISYQTPRVGSKMDTLFNISLAKESAKPPSASLSRPVPLFKLENELADNVKANSSSNLIGNKKYWKSEDSFKPTMSFNNILAVTNQNYSEEEEEEAELDIEDHEDGEEDTDFMREKHKSDQSYLSKLNQIVNTSELRVENNADFSLYSNNNNNNSRRQRKNGSLLYSPSQASLNSDRNQSRISNFVSRPNSSASTPNKMFNIPPADKTMEVVVGKGRRVVGSAMASTRSNSQSKLNGLPPTARPKTSAAAATAASSQTTNSAYKCENCDKKYNNIKDLDIHKLYCNLKK